MELLVRGMLALILATASDAPDEFHFSDTDPIRPPRAADAAEAEMEEDLSSLSAMVLRCFIDPEY